MQFINREKYCWQNKNKKYRIGALDEEVNRRPVDVTCLSYLDIPVCPHHVFSFAICFQSVSPRPCWRIAKNAIKKLWQILLTEWTRYSYHNEWNMYIWMKLRLPPVNVILILASQFDYIIFLLTPPQFAFDYLVSTVILLPNAILGNNLANIWICLVFSACYSI